MLIHNITFPEIIQSTMDQSVSLSIETPQLYNGRFACPDDEITFLCETKGSSTISWSSNEYIGQGGAQLQFAAIEVINTKHRIGNTTATFTDKRTEDGVQVLQSTLRVTATSMYPNPSVTCIHGNEGRRSANFSVIDIYIGKQAHQWTIEYHSKVHIYINRLSGLAHAQFLI
jgi:hypothetical protein